jgi:hypothetical protein
MEERVMNNIEDGGANEEDKYVAYLPSFTVGIY